MSATTGFNETAADFAIDGIIAGGADVRLMTTALAYGDGATELDSKEVSDASYTSVTVAEADWTVSVDATTNTTTLENASKVDFGTAGGDWGVVVEVAIHQAGTDRFVIADETNDPDITEGEEVSFAAGELTYTLGDA